MITATISFIVGVFVGGTLMGFCNAASHRDNIRYPDSKEKEWGN